MPMKRSHAWDLTPSDAIALQKQWAGYVDTTDRFGEVSSVAGVDVGFENNGEVTRAAIVVLAYPSLTLIDSALIKQPTRYPYIPGLLSFRELPAVLAAYDCLQQKPDLILCDGQGTAHPRLFGIACHLGVWLDVPTIGVGKTRLCGVYEEVPNEKGAWVPLQLPATKTRAQQNIGAVLRTREGVKPIYVSPGHRVSLGSSVEWVMNCITRYKLPETTRAAHHLASNMK